MYNFTLLSETAEALGLSNRDIAVALNVGESTVSRYMTGAVKDPNLYIITDLCDLLHLSMDVVCGRDAMIELPAKEGATLTENLVILRDFVRRNFERLRTVEQEKDGVFNRHIEHLEGEVEKTSKFLPVIFALIALCGLMLGLMVMMFVNNRSLNAQVRDLQQHIMECPGTSTADDDTFPK